MAFQVAANLFNAAQFSTANCWFALSNPNENFVTIVTNFRDQFFSLLNPDVADELDIYTWALMLQAQLDMVVTTGGLQARAQDAWEISRTVNAACQEAGLKSNAGKISAALTASLLAAYNSAFS